MQILVWDHHLHFALSPSALIFFCLALARPCHYLNGWSTDRTNLSSSLRAHHLLFWERKDLSLYTRNLFLISVPIHIYIKNKWAWIWIVGLLKGWGQARLCPKANTIFLGSCLAQPSFQAHLLGPSPALIGTSAFGLASGFMTIFF